MNKQVFKVLSVVLAVALAFGLVPMGSANAATISDADIQYPMESIVNLDLTGTTAELYHPDKWSSYGAYESYFETSYLDGTLTVKFKDSGKLWVPIKHLANITLKNSVKGYRIPGTSKSGQDPVPLFVYSDGTVFAFQYNGNYIQYGYYNNKASYTQYTDTATWAYTYPTDANVIYDVVFNDDATQATIKIIQGENVLLTKTITAARYNKNADVLTDHLPVYFSNSMNATSGATFKNVVDVDAYVVDNQPIIDFVNAHPILIDIKNATAFDAMDFASRADEAEAAKNAFDLLTEDLQAAIVANDFYNVDEINLIINAKALALVAPYLAADFAVTEANAASVKANIATAQTNGTYDKLTSDEQTTLNKLYYEAMARVDGTVAVDFTSDSTAVSLVDGLSYNIPTYTGFGFKKASLTASFTVDASAQDGTQCIDLDLYVRQSRRVRLNNFRIEDGKILADIDMYVAGQKWSTAKKTGFVIGTANGDTLGEFTTDELTFSFELTPFWSNKNLLQPKWTVRNENQNVEVNFKDEGETESVNLAQNLSFDLTQSYQKTTPTVHSMNIIYYDAALGKPTVDGATIKTVTDAANQGLRIQSSFTATEIPSGYELVEFGAVYTTTSSLKGQALALDTNPAVTVTAPAGTDLQTFHLNINGAADDYFAFTNFTIRSYVTYKSTVTGKTFTIYSANGDRAVNGELTRRVVDVAVAMYNQKLKTLGNVDATTYPDFESDRTTLEGVLANGVAGYEGARGRLDALLAFACKYQTLVKG